MATSALVGAFSKTAPNIPLGSVSPPLPTAVGSVKQPDRHGQELFLNHLWESLNSGAKILFFAVATPFMLSTWGSEQFGLFAVANSCVALVGFLDLGLRTLTRLGLTNPRLSDEAKMRLHAVNVAAFSIASATCVAIVGLLASAGIWHRWLHLSANGDAIITATVALTALLMWAQLAFERIAAARYLSRIKACSFAGNLLAFGIVVVLLKRGATVYPVTIAYFAALAFPLLTLLPFANLQPRLFANALLHLRPREIFEALRSGGYINLITASWIFQSYGLVLLISWMLGPAAAGVFFLYLKLSEVLSVLGASASEPTVAAIACALTAADRRRRLAVGYRSALALCLAGAVGYAFFAGDLFRIWLHRMPDHPYTGLLIGLFGVTSGFTRIVTAASLGLAKPRPIALALFAGAIVVTASIAAVGNDVGPEAILAILCATALFALPSAAIVARELESTFTKTWLKPLASFATALVSIVVICWMAASLNHLGAVAAASGISTLICLRYVFQSAPGDEGNPPKDGLFGYDTRSRRSALVMRIVDLINPFRRAEKFRWSGPCIVSSAAGLGDLFIHLPLIAGIVKEAQRRRLDIRIGLRPAHAAIGAACGWNVLPFDPALEDFFKNPFAIRPMELFRQIRKSRLTKSKLWIDLAGNAISALSIKCAGARRIAARVTRGGRSLVDHHLPHRLHENEYENVTRVAETLGCEPDYEIFDRLRGDADPETKDGVVLCLTTVCRWRNWPLENFLALVDRFPEVQFVATGLAAEVAPEERAVFAQILHRPNVLPRVGTTSILELIRLIAHARAVVTNDTSTAHIANAFHKPGAALFGPASPNKLAAPYGLRAFVDATCPFHPCVQWTCSNQENWCMRKIAVAPVAKHLANVLQIEAPYAATASLA